MCMHRMPLCLQVGTSIRNNIEVNFRLKAERQMGYLRVPEFHSFNHR